MRGKLSRVQSHFNSGRLIPAHAGKTKVKDANTTDFTAHPRACGENHCFTDTANLSAGSSPRMRGKRDCLRFLSLYGGLIPAHAGKTMMPLIALDRTGAHPRACGENTVTFGPSGSSPGSSPRMRGKPSLFIMRTMIDGLIPAHAGKTVD